MILDRVTITGVDNTVEMSFIDEMTSSYSSVEWGVLLTNGTRKGGPRYPDDAWLAELTTTFKGKYDQNFAAHFCGDLCDELIGESGESYKSGVLVEHSEPYFFSRVQLNSFPDGKWMPWHVNSLAASLAKVEIIVPLTSDHALFLARHPFHESVTFLYDDSRGRGIRPDEWPPITHVNDRVIGFAGGINPNNIREVLDEFSTQDVDGWFWLDMETGVRTDDRFDYTKVEEILRVAMSYT